MKINMKQVVLWLVVIMISSFTIVGILVKKSGGFSFTANGIKDGINLNSENTKHISETRIFSVEDLEEISVDTISTDINFITSERDDIEVNFYGDATVSSSKQIPKLITDRKGDKLSVKIEHPKTIISLSLNISNVKLDIYLPENYSKNIKIDTTSGDTKIGYLHLDRFNHDSISGDLSALSITSNNISLDSTSGNYKLRGNIGNLNANTISGDIFIEYENFSNYINMGTTSGDIDLKLPETADFNLDVSTVSGDIETEFPIMVKGSSKKNSLEGTVGDGGNDIEINTISGNVRLYY